MRFAAPVLSTAALALCAVVVLAGGRSVIVAPAPDAAAEIAAPEPEAAAAVPVKHRPASASRLVAPAIVAPPELDPAELEWASPRAPLSELSMALPPKPRVDPEWDGETLVRPVAVESAVVEAMGRRVAIAGTISVAPGETCVSEGKDWACGISARTAFRAWLRGRSLVCALPEEAREGPATAPCRLGRQDAGAWLVANGWARAAPGGAYVAAQAKAEADRKGIFGPPPDLSDLPPAPASLAASPLPDQPVLSE